MNYLQALAEQIEAELPRRVVPDVDKEALFAFCALLCLVKGESVSARDVHDAWTAWMSIRAEKHESMRPFEELAPEVQAEDMPFVEAIRRVALRLE